MITSPPCSTSVSIYFRSLHYSQAHTEDHVTKINETMNGSCGTCQSEPISKAFLKCPLKPSNKPDWVKNKQVPLLRKGTTQRGADSCPPGATAPPPPASSTSGTKGHERNSKVKILMMLKDVALGTCCPLQLAPESITPVALLSGQLWAQCLRWDHLFFLPQRTCLET